MVTSASVSFDFTNCRQHGVGYASNLCDCLKKKKQELLILLELCSVSGLELAVLDRLFVGQEQKRLGVIKLGGNLKGLSSHLKGRISFDLVSGFGGNDRLVITSVYPTLHPNTRTPLETKRVFVVGAVRREEHDGYNHHLLFKSGKLLSSPDPLKLFLQSTNPLSQMFLDMLRLFYLKKSLGYKHLICTDEIPCSEHDGGCDCNQINFDDEMLNLDRPTTGCVVALADLGLWHGRRAGFKLLGRNVNEIFNITTNGSNTFYTDAYNVLSRNTHHDGTNYVMYREVKEDNYVQAIERIVLNEGRMLTSREISRFTKSLLPYVNKVYGW